MLEPCFEGAEMERVWKAVGGAGYRVYPHGPEYSYSEAKEIVLAFMDGVRRIMVSLMDALAEMFQEAGNAARRFAAALSDDMVAALKDGDDDDEAEDEAEAADEGDDLDEENEYELWIRLGANDTYEPVGDIQEAATYISNFLLNGDIHRSTDFDDFVRCNEYGITNADFPGPGYVSIFWGDGDAQPDHEISDDELDELNETIKRELA